MKSINEIELSEQARIALVHHLRQAGAIQSESVAQAFLSTPREAFIPTFFEQEKFTWRAHAKESYAPDAWIAAIYRDEPLVTWIDGQNYAGSSSSAPTVMAMMLEALAVQPGMHVLEIGTGSGYNAALLAYLVGNPALVTTIDVEEALARSAQQVLDAVIGPVQVEVGDGYAGIPLSAPYDRIIATASSPVIPPAWYEQLAPNGRLVMDLQGSLRKSSFLVIEKKPDGSASGRFDSRYLYFMPMRSGPSATSPVKRLLQQPSIQRIVLEQHEMATDLFGNVAFHWYLQWAIPGTTMTKAKMKAKDGVSSIPFVTMIDPQESTIIQLYLRESEWSGYERGSGDLWESILQAYHAWEAIGRPDQGAYHVEWSQQQACFQLCCRSQEVVRTFYV
jgi:protein-L-isoaspartate(D-aspartate) O-methyltransferase